MHVRRTTVAAALAVIVALLLADHTFFYFRDNFATHYPIKVISARVWQGGAIPWWNFYDGGGQPLAGNPNTLSFYPDNILYLVLPAHVAFNLHFILHLLLGWFAMRALARSRFAAWLYVFSGIAVSLLAFYNMVAAFALVPFAWLATERRSWAQLGLAFGLMALAGEPVTIAGAAIGCAILAWRHMPPLRIGAAIVLALLIASPLLIAYSEIAGEVERGAVRYSARTVLAASLEPQRILEVVVGPLFPVRGPHLFLSLLIGVMVIPAIARKSRYTLIAAVMLFFALGRFNPLVSWAVESFDFLRLGRFPEKFALPMCVALVWSAAAGPPLSLRMKSGGLAAALQTITIVQLLVWAVLTIPIDRFAPYDVPPQPARRVVMTPLAGGQTPDRGEYRERARRLEPLFGAVAGLRYALDRSPDGMFSIRTRIAAERFAATRNANYARIVTELPRAMIVPRTMRAADPVKVIESAAFDPRASAPAPIDFVSPPAARVVSFIEHPQSLEIVVDTPARALLLVNETYFRAWDAGGLETLPIDLDRLGVLVPAGRTTVTLTFGRHHVAVVVMWIVSTLAIIAALLAGKPPLSKAVAAPPLGGLKPAPHTS